MWKDPVLSLADSPFFFAEAAVDLTGFFGGVHSNEQHPWPRSHELSYTRLCFLSTWCQAAKPARAYDIFMFPPSPDVFRDKPSTFLWKLLHTAWRFFDFLFQICAVFDGRFSTFTHFFLSISWCFSYFASLFSPHFFLLKATVIYCSMHICNHMEAEKKAQKLLLEWV